MHMLVENATSPWGQSWERVFHKHSCIQFIALVPTQDCPHGEIRHLTISLYVNILLLSSHSSILKVFFLDLKKILVILIFLNIGALFIIIQFGYYPWVPKFWVPNPHGYPRVIPKKTQNFDLYGYPTRKYPWNSDTNPTQPIPKIWFGSGYYPWVPELWVPNPRHSSDPVNELKQ